MNNYNTIFTQVTQNLTANVGKIQETKIWEKT